MRSFAVLLKNELKLNIRNMNMVIFAVLLPLVGASSYTIHDGGIEIEIDTRPDQRQKGLALRFWSNLLVRSVPFLFALAV